MILIGFVVYLMRSYCVYDSVKRGCVCQIPSMYEEFSIEYFNAASDTSPSAAAQNTTITTRQTAMDLTDTIQVTLKAEATSAGRDIAQQGTIRVTRVGALITYATP